MTPESLRAWRSRLGLSKTEAAMRLGINRRTLALYEKGKFPIPKTVAIACAAVALGIEEHP